METGKVNSQLLYPRRGMVVTSTDMYAQQQKMGQITKKPAVEWIALYVNCIE